MFRRTTRVIGERPRLERPRTGLLITLAAMFALLAAAASPAQELPIRVAPLERCTTSGGREHCRPVSIDQLDLAEPIEHLRQAVIVAPSAAASQLPLTITLVGMMSSEVRWNGVLIGRNGVVGADRTSETAGRFHAAIPVPRQILRIGRNVVDIRMSAHHRWLPVRVPVQQIGVGFYEAQSARELRAYWPALLTAGALLLAMLYFGVAAIFGRKRRDATILFGVSAAAAAQLALETGRSLIDYAYPWQVTRLAGIVALASVTAVLMCTYAARRFLVDRARPASLLSVGTSVAAVLLLPSFDAKAWACLGMAGIICLFCAASVAHRRRDGRAGVIVALVFCVMIPVGRGDALDRGYYIFLAMLMAGLVAEQILELRHVYSRYDAEREHSETLSTRLRAAENAGRSIVSIQDGARIHRLVEKEIVNITAADDFCELHLLDRQPLLVGATMKTLAATLPGRFIRVHKSHIVNMSHVVGLKPGTGSRPQLLLKNGHLMPIGRTYLSLVRESLLDLRPPPTPGQASRSQSSA